VEYKFYAKRGAEKKNVKTKKKRDEAGPSILLVDSNDKAWMDIYFPSEEESYSVV
jgi:hypothetical protein